MGAYRAHGLEPRNRGAAVSTNTQIGRLEALRRSLEHARSAGHVAVPVSLKAQHDLYMQGLNDGVQLAIDAIGWEIKIVEAGQKAVLGQHQ